MNREIKFRGFSKELNSWVYGFLQEVDVEGVGYSYIFWQGNTTFVEANSVGQFTGFKDFDGKEIYEGDILNYNGITSNGNKIIREVNYNAENARFQSGMYILTQSIELSEIIGNVYENPEFTQSSE